MRKEKKNRNKELGLAMLPWIFAGGIFIVIAAFAIGNGNRFLGSAAKIFSGTMRDAFVSEENLKLVAEIGTKDEINDSTPQDKTVSLAKEEESIGNQEKEKKESLPLIREEKRENPTTSIPIYKNEPKECNLESPQSPNYNAFLNEIAWMGTAEGASDEWIELKPNGSQPVDLRGWQIVTDGTMRIAFTKGAIPGGGFYLLERTDDNTLPGVLADTIYTGSLSNMGERLRIFDDTCELVDEIDARSGWPGGENDSKKTLERNVYDPGWHTSASPGGTPKAKNSSPVAVQANVQLVAPPSENISPSPPPPEPPQEPTSTTVTATQNSPRVIINEIFYDAEESDTGKEFVELYNAGESDADLQDWSLLNGSTSLAKIGSKTEDAHLIKSKSFFLIGLNGYTGTPVADVKRSASLPNTSAMIVLKDASGAEADSVSYSNSVSAGQSFERVTFGGTEFAAQSNPSPKNSQGQ